MQRGVRWVSDRIRDGQHPNRERRPRLLLLCDFRPHEAATVLDHIEAIRKWSRYDVFVLPIHGDIPDEVDLEAFDGLAIHYNLIASNDSYLSPLARWRVSQFPGVKAAFIQDEYRFVNRTVSVMRTLGIQVLFTCVPQDQVELVYPAAGLPAVKRRITVLTGYVPEQLLSLPVLPYADRTIDVGYRGRRVPAWLGRLAQEKAAIADRFATDAPGFGLTTDISYTEKDRLYGQAWITFMSRIKAMLGVESGASVFDFDGSIERAVRGYLAAHPDASFEDVHRLFLADVDGRIRLNQISPRCFEAAALGTLMVLYPGDYSGVLEPWRHYVPLQKDHSNMAEVVRAIRDRETWERITKHAREEVAFNPRHSFRAMVETVDSALDLTVTAAKTIDPAVFERSASRSFARLRSTQLYALGLPPAVNRVRLIAGLAMRAFIPSPIAILPSTHPLNGQPRRLRGFVRLVRSLTFWAVRPRILPPAVLAAHGVALLRDLSALGHLQVMGARAFAAGGGTPFVILVTETSRDVRVVVRTDVPASGRLLAVLPHDLSWASEVSLHLSDQWLVPAGVGEGTRPLHALSAALRARPDVARKLLTWSAPWCDVVLSGESADGPLVHGSSTACHDVQVKPGPPLQEGTQQSLSMDESSPPNSDVVEVPSIDPDFRVSAKQVTNGASRYEIGMRCCSTRRVRVVQERDVLPRRPRPAAQPSRRSRQSHLQQLAHGVGMVEHDHRCSALDQHPADLLD